jgi:hypothetical protein
LPDTVIKSEEEGLIVTLAEEEHPKKSEAVTVYVPAARFCMNAVCSGGTELHR